MLLTFAAADALGGEGRFSGQADGLSELKPALAFGLSEHGVVAAEDAGDIDAFGTGHAVAAAGAADLLLCADLALHFLQDRKVRLRQVAGFRLGSGPAVLFDHPDRIHAGEDDRDLRLVIEPAESPLGGRPAAAAIPHGLLRALGQVVDQLAAAQGFHDDDRNSLLRGRPDAGHTGLRDIVQIVVLNLAEIPVIIVQDLQEILRVPVVGKADVADRAALFLLPDPVQDTHAFEFLPHGNVRHVVHEIIIHVGGAQTGQFLLKGLLQPFFAGNQELGELGRDMDLFPDVVALEDLPDRRLAPGIDVGCIVIVDARPVGGHDLPLRLVDVDISPFCRKAHAAEAQDGKRGPVFIISIEHRLFSLLSCCVRNSSL